MPSCILYQMHLQKFINKGIKKFIFDIISNQVFVILQNHKIRSQEGISRSFLPTQNFRAGMGTLESIAFRARLHRPLKCEVLRCQQFKILLSQIKKFW